MVRVRPASKLFQFLLLFPLSWIAVKSKILLSFPSQYFLLNASVEESSYLAIVRKERLPAASLSRTSPKGHVFEGSFEIPCLQALRLQRSLTCSARFVRLFRHIRRRFTTSVWNQLNQVLRRYRNLQSSPRRRRHLMPKTSVLHLPKRHVYLQFPQTASRSSQSVLELRMAQDTVVPLGIPDDQSSRSKSTTDSPSTR